MLLALAVAPLSLRALNDLVDASGKNQSYLPSFEIRRTRKMFRTRPVEQLRESHPGWVFIGDSMLGTRIEPGLLGAISGSGDRGAAVLVQAASGPAYWYLAFKNQLAASGASPRMTFFFFRDTNMTDTMFRLQSTLGDALDELAHAQEPELDAIIAERQRGRWSHVDALLNRLYEVDAASAWIQPSVRRWYAYWHYPDPEVRLSFEQMIEDDFNDNFRRDVAADIGVAEEHADFSRDLPSSVLPLIIDISQRKRLPVCFVRVQRRPEGNRPPAEPPALVRYLDHFRQWAESHGACFYDETGDPELTLDLYEDGDHFRDRAVYTRIFRQRLDPLFREDHEANGNGR
jgi:hypothetical protein